MSELNISWVPREEIIDRYSNIRPVVRKDKKLYWLRAFNRQELFNISYLWDDNDVDRRVQDDEIIPIPSGDFRCLHRYGHYGLFKPSVAEVLTQIDQDILDDVAAFEIIDSPKIVDDFSKDDFTRMAFDAGYHVSTVRLYRPAK